MEFIGRFPPPGEGGFNVIRPPPNFDVTFKVKSFKFELGGWDISLVLFYKFKFVPD